MSDPSSPGPEPVSRALANLREVAPLLREAHHLDPDVRQNLADLVEDLVQVIDPAAPSLQTAHLAESSAQLVEALHRHHHAGLLASAKQRLEDAAARAATEAPVATGLARRLIDVLAGLGI
ncbi:MAG: hypothetical protein JOZ53_17400 [Planctomycetaceae bacterium]|nr:hypothetical protein [Planctomycetaceae bacterium]